MKNFGIQEACSENWQAMTSTEKGAFCQKCATEVIDFTNKSTNEIKSTLRDLAGKTICSRLTEKQITDMNVEFEQWQSNSKRSMQTAMLFSLIVVFGLTLFSCSSEREEKAILKIQETVTQSISESKTPEVKIGKMLLPTAPPSAVKIDEAVFEIPSEIDSTATTLDEISVIRRSEYYVVGMSVSSPRFEEFLLQDSVTQAPEFDENGLEIPTVFSANVFPNPANIQTTLQMGLPTADFFQINVYDISGKFLQNVYEGKLNRGTFRYNIDLTTYPTGMYLVNIHSKSYSESLKVIKQ